MPTGQQPEVLSASPVVRYYQKYIQTDLNLRNFAIRLELNWHTSNDDTSVPVPIDGDTFFFFFLLISSFTCCSI